MGFSVKTTHRFTKEAKQLGKKYPTLYEDILKLIELLENEPLYGTPLGKGFYKIRMAIKSKGKGKSGGARVISFVKVTNETVFLATIYDKSIKGDISKKELNNMLKELKV